MTAPKKKREEAKLGKTKSVGYGYVARWPKGYSDMCSQQVEEEPLGFFVPHVAGDYIVTPALPDDERAILRHHEQRLVLCKITVEQVFDSKGRAITRKI